MNELQDAPRSFVVRTVFLAKNPLHVVPSKPNHHVSRCGTRFNAGFERCLLLLGQKRRPTRTLTVWKTLDALGIEAVHPVAKLPLGQSDRLSRLGNRAALLQMKHPKQSLPHTPVRFITNQPSKVLNRKIRLNPQSMSNSRSPYQGLEIYIGYRSLLS